MNTANATNSSIKSANFTNAALRDMRISFAWRPSNEGLDDNWHGTDKPSPAD